MKNVISSWCISALVFMMVISFGKDEDTLFKDCVLPWTKLEPITQAELPKEIVDFAYLTFTEVDTLTGGVIKFCDAGNRLLIQSEGTANYDFLLYDSCGKYKAKGQAESDSDIRSLLSQNIQQELGLEASLYDSLF